MTSTPYPVALITGASSGIGKAIAFSFAKAGIHLALVSRSKERLEQLATQLTPTGITVKTYAVDLSVVSEVKDKIATIGAELEPLSILVNNAGMGYTADLLNTPCQDWQKVLDLNLTSVFQCIQGVLPGMRDRQHGTIVNISSIAGHQAFSGWGAYCVSKAALISLSKVLAVEERKHGIRVTTVCPGAVNTPIWDSDTVHVNFDRSTMLTPEVVANVVLQAVQLPQEFVIEELTVMPTAGVL
ncbi:MAG: SDR family oxidoreductase [Synechococcales bacterium]|nr:SDR family oxidoreductase [Cyanobacteria bacterium REEB444]MEB3124697.1 SDR family oxidoreductase [Synechococcales bacterium]